MSCPAGSYCPSNSTEHITCPMGSYCPINSTEPITCPPGSYCPTTGLSKPISSPPGTFLTHTGAMSVKDASICPIGSYCPTGSTNAIPCPAGSFCTITGNSEIVSRNTTASPSFLPSDVPGLTLWLDANDFNTDTPYTWTDKSINKFTASCPNESDKPIKSTIKSTINTKYAVSLNGNNYFSVPIPEGTFSDYLNILFVYNVPDKELTDYCAPVSRTSGGVDGPLDQYNSERFINGEWFSSKHYYNPPGPSENLTLITQLLSVSRSDTVIKNSYTTFYECVNGDYTDPSVNNKKLNTIANDKNTKNFYIGTRDDKVTRFVGKICEVLVYNQAINSAQQKRLEGYLAHKWDITNLYHGHTYKSTPPTIDFANCEVSGWSGWSLCSANCGGGKLTRQRNVKKAAYNGGSECPELIETKACNTQECPVDCKVSDWSAWGACSATCGGGTQTRKRTVDKPAYNGGKCPELIQTQACNTQECPVDCIVSGWSPWTPCDKQCGGTQTRTRNVIREPLYNGKSCPVLIDTQDCDTQVCLVSTLGSGFNNPKKIAVDGEWNVYVSDTDNGVIKKITTNGTVITLATEFNKTHAVTVDRIGNVYVAYSNNNNSYTDIKKITPSGKVISRGSEIYSPNGISVDGEGNIYLTESGNDKIKKINLDGSVSIIGFTFNKPCGVAVDGAGNVYVADTGNNNIKKFNRDGSGLVSILANGFSFNKPCGVAVDGAGNVYVADTFNNEIKKINRDGSVSILATGFSFNRPYGVAVDGAGNVYVADTGNNKIKKITMDGTVNCKVIGRGAWSTCDKSCGGGSQTRTITTQATNEGACPVSSQTQECNTHSCPVDCIVSGWGPWGECNAVCGEGKTIQLRNIIKEADYGGVACPELSQSKECNIKECNPNHIPSIIYPSTDSNIYTFVSNSSLSSYPITKISSSNSNVVNSFTPISNTNNYTFTIVTPYVNESIIITATYGTNASVSITLTVKVYNEPAPGYGRDNLSSYSLNIPSNINSFYAMVTGSSGVNTSYNGGGTGGTVSAIVKNTITNSYNIRVGTTGITGGNGINGNGGDYAMIYNTNNIPILIGGGGGSSGRGFGGVGGASGVSPGVSPGFSPGDIYYSAGGIGGIRPGVGGKLYGSKVSGDNGSNKSGGNGDSSSTISGNTGGVGGKCEGNTINSIVYYGGGGGTGVFGGGGGGGAGVGGVGGFGVSGINSTGGGGAGVYGGGGGGGGVYGGGGGNGGGGGGGSFYLGGGGGSSYANPDYASAVSYSSTNTSTTGNVIIVYYHK